jgi:hypothetical protein
MYFRAKVKPVAIISMCFVDQFAVLSGLQTCILSLHDPYFAKGSFTDNSQQSKVVEVDWKHQKRSAQGFHWMWLKQLMFAWYCAIIAIASGIPRTLTVKRRFLSLTIPHWHVRTERPED